MSDFQGHFSNILCIIYRGDYPCELSICGHSNDGNGPWVVGLISSSLEQLSKDVFRALPW